MAVNPTSAVNPAASSASSKSISGFAQNFDSFLTLLTAQLKNQDPLSPMDSTQFTTQLVQFTGVEQSIRQNQSLETLIGLQKGSSSAAAVNYLGKTVKTDGSSLLLSGATGTLDYSLAGPSAGTTIAILDSQGGVIRTLNGANTPGQHSIAWDGRSDNGTLYADGSYSVRISAKDSNNNPVAVSTGLTGVVTDVSLADDKIILTVGGNKIPLTDVVSVRSTPTT